MNIFDSLNEQQQIALNGVIDWFYNSSVQTISITGGAGTGKSYLLGAILKKLDLDPSEILPMAYTGQACSVMRKRGLITACTCHSGLFYPVKEPLTDQLGRPVIDKQFNTPITTWKFVDKDFTDSNIKLIILDEAWMIPRSFRQKINKTGIKVLATGDPYQLPPITGDPAYLINDPCYHLTQLMRQSESSPIVYLANRAKDGLDIETGYYGNALVIYDDEFNDNMLARSSIALCGRNFTRESLNNRVRHSIMKINSDYPQLGERIICRKNNWDIDINGIALVNGLVGSVVKPPDIGRFNGETMELDFLPDMLDVPFCKLQVNKRYLNASYDEREKYKRNPFLKGERFEYAYSSTVHLAQGSEYDCGTYIEEFMNSNIQNALNYTAITRFKKMMIYVKHKPKYWNFYMPDSNIKNI